MNKKEMNTILNTYKDVYQANMKGFDHSDSIRTLKYMLDKLNLEKERYIIENEVIAEYNNMSIIIKDTYQMIFEDFLRYGRLVHYDLKEIEHHYDDIEFVMTEEENICHKHRINYIKNYNK